MENTEENQKNRFLEHHGFTFLKFSRNLIYHEIFLQKIKMSIRHATISVANIPPFLCSTIKVDLFLDNIKRDLNELSGDFTNLNLPIVYIGGTPEHSPIRRAIYKNYIGCLRNVTLKLPKLDLNLIDLALAGSNQIILNGRALANCQPSTDPVTFISPESHIPITTWPQFPALHSFSIDFQTTENHGLLAYALAADTNDLAALSPVLSLTRHFFALEIHNRLLNAYFNFGQGYVRAEIADVDVSDGKPHQVSVQIGQDFATLRFDEKHEKTLRLERGEGLNVAGPMVIGGIATSHRSGLIAPLPPYFFSGLLGHGFVGCVQDVSVNGEFVNMTEAAVVNKAVGVAFGTCAAGTGGECELGQCVNEGVCVEGWNRLTCDCSATGFNGPVCSQRKKRLGFLLHFWRGLILCWFLKLRLLRISRRGAM